MRKFSNNVQPVLKMSRSKFDLSYTYKTTMNVGDLCPVYLQEVYPGDTFKEKTTFVIRTTNPYIRPVMDNLFLDIYFFFVPNRIVWDNWQALMGENTAGYWAQQQTYEVPQVNLPYAASAGPAIAPDTIASYFGINIGQGLPVGSQDAPATISELPFRGFALIYNEWFRNENFESPAYINKGDTPAMPPTLNNLAWSYQNIWGKVPKVNKLADYFTSCLPAPQKGDAVDIPIANAPVIAAENVDFYDKNTDYFKLAKGPLGQTGSGANGVLGIYDSYKVGTGSIDGPDSYTYNASAQVAPWNLLALTSEAIGNINDLRFAFQLQKMLEKDARGGTRYVEYLASHFGVLSPDARLQRPEFLGGKRTPLQVQEVAQTSESSNSSPLAQLSAYSATINASGFSKGFVEHGFIIGVACIRQRHTYQQGIERFWWRKDRYDFYDPVFANIGEQPVYRKEIYAEGITAAQTGTIFGYQEAWADLRFRPGRVTGYLNSTSGSGFDIYHFGDIYQNAPVLGNTWQKETNAYVDRTLSVGSASAPNFVVDMFHRNVAARVLPTYSIPGLVDHH